MASYYVYIKYGSKLTGKMRTLGWYNLDRAFVKKYVVEPIRVGNEFLLAGRRINPQHIEELLIIETEKAVAEIAKETKLSPESILDKMKKGILGRHVTQEFVISLSRHAKAKGGKKSGRHVFIVHGRDLKSVEELKSMLTAFGIDTMVLSEQPSGSRTTVEKLEKYADKVGYAFVILSPDDIGCLKNSYEEIASKALGKAEGGGTDKEKLELAKQEILRLLSSRARQNVVLEFGFFMGRLGRRRVCCLLKGNVERPSDMDGIVYLPFKESVNEARNMILKELKAAGYSLVTK